MNRYYWKVDLINNSHNKAIEPLILLTNEISFPNQTAFTQKCSEIKQKRVKIQGIFDYKKGDYSNI